MQNVLSSTSFLLSFFPLLKEMAYVPTPASDDRGQINFGWLCFSDNNLRETSILVGIRQFCSDLKKTIFFWIAYLAFTLVEPIICARYPKVYLFYRLLVCSYCIILESSFVCSSPWFARLSCKNQFISCLILKIIHIIILGGVFSLSSCSISSEHIIFFHWNGR